MYQHVKALKGGKSVMKPIYNHTTGLLDAPEKIDSPKILVRRGEGEGGGRPPPGLPSAPGYARTGPPRGDGPVGTGASGGERAEAASGLPGHGIRAGKNPFPWF